MDFSKDSYFKRLGLLGIFISVSFLPSAVNYQTLTWWVMTCRLREQLGPYPSIFHSQSEFPSFYTSLSATRLSLHKDTRVTMQ